MAEYVSKQDIKRKRISIADLLNDEIPKGRALLPKCTVEEPLMEKRPRRRAKGGVAPIWNDCDDEFLFTQRFGIEQRLQPTYRELVSLLPSGPNHRTEISLRVRYHNQVNILKRAIDIASDEQ